jgi:hypothetical protein
MGHLPVVFSVNLPCLLSVVSGMKVVTPCYGSMVRRLFVISGFVVFSCLAVMVGSMCVMFRSFLVVLRSFPRHQLFLSSLAPPAFLREFHKRSKVSEGDGLQTAHWVHVNRVMDNSFEPVIKSKAGPDRRFWLGFLPVCLSVSLRSLLSVPSSVNLMSPPYDSVVRALLVISGLVVFGRLPEVAGGLGEMFRSFLVVFRCFLRHELFLHSLKCQAK